MRLWPTVTCRDRGRRRVRSRVTKRARTVTHVKKERNANEKQPEREEQSYSNYFHRLKARAWYGTTKLWWRFSGPTHRAPPCHACAQPLLTSRCPGSASALSLDYAENKQDVAAAAAGTVTNAANATAAHPTPRTRHPGFPPDPNAAKRSPVVPSRCRRHHRQLALAAVCAATTAIPATATATNPIPLHPFGRHSPFPLFPGTPPLPRPPRLRHSRSRHHPPRRAPPRTPVLSPVAVSAAAATAAAAYPPAKRAAAVVPRAPTETPLSSPPFPPRPKRITTTCSF